MKTRKINLPLLFFAFLLVLIPLSVDSGLNVRIHNLNFRLQYLGASLIFIIWFFKEGMGNSLLELKKHLNQSHNIFFLCMAIVGFLGLLKTTYPFRVFFFLLWSIGTCIFVPFLGTILIENYKYWVHRLIAIYFLIQSLIILIDVAICIPTGGAMHIGRVMVYDFFKGERLCRPSAFYQEPGYFCAAALLCLVLLRTMIPLESSKKWKSFLFFSYFVICAAMGTSLSRLGWLGLGLIIFWELFDYLKTKKNIVHIFPQFKKILVGSIIPLIVVIYVLTTKGAVIYSYLGRPFSGTDDSIGSRVKSSIYALKVFQKSPLVGVGPGGTGAYIVDHQNDLSIELPERYRNLPISQNLYTELLSDWGILGTILFVVGMFFMLIKNCVHPNKFLLFLALGLIYTSNSTLARFDFWFFIGILKQIFSNGKNRIFYSKF